MSINGINVTRTWKITTYVGFSVDDISDYSYYSLKGMYFVDSFKGYSVIIRRASYRMGLIQVQRLPSFRCGVLIRDFGLT